MKARMKIEARRKSGIPLRDIKLKQAEISGCAL